MRALGGMAMCNEISYRTATPHDAAEMVAVHFRSVQAIPERFYVATIKDSWSPDPDSNRIAWLSGVVSSEDTIVMVACQGKEKVAGFVIFSKPEHQIMALYVDPAFAGQGVGASLLGSIEESANAGSITLKASLNAINFFSRNGSSGIRDTGQRLSDGTVMAAVDMVKTLGGMLNNAVNKDG